MRNTLIFRTTLTGPNWLKLTHYVYYIFTYITTFGTFKQNGYNLTPNNRPPCTTRITHRWSQKPDTIEHGL